MNSDYIWAVGLFVMSIATGYFALEITYYKKLIAETRKSADLSMESFINREREIMLQIDALETDSNRLAKLVSQMVEDVDKMAASLPSGLKSPQMHPERDALRLHKELVAARSAPITK